MIRKMGIQWNLRTIIAARNMFSTADLVPELAERGVSLSREQVYRLVTQTPQRLSMPVLAALCDILQCRVSEVIEIRVEQKSLRRIAGERTRQDIGTLRPVRARIKRPDTKK